MRIALVSDIHGNLPALEAVLADAQRRGVTQVVNLGDCFSGPLWPEDTARFLIAAGWPTLAGNHERQLLTVSANRRSPEDALAQAQLSPASLEWMGRLPATMRLTDEVFLCHGSPRRDVEYLLETAIPGGTRLATAAEIELRLAGQAAAVVACGHSHLPRVVRTASGQLLVNPGSVGLPAFDDAHPVWHVAETGAPDARYAILERTDRGWTASLHAVPYDFERAARQAEAHGMIHWAVPLRTGYMPATH